MRIALDISGISGENSLQHRVRGVGTYTENLKKALEQYFPTNQYTFFSRGETLSKNIDLVHFTYFEPFKIDLPFFKKWPTVVTVHDLIPLVFPEHFPAGIKGQLKWNIQKNLLQRTDSVIADSFSSKKDIIKYAGVKEEKIHVIYLAASKEFKKITDTILLQSIKVKYRLPEQFILYVGDVTWNKNLPRLIEAMNLVNIPLVMIGKALSSDDFDSSNLWNQDLIKVNQLSKDNPKIIKLGFVPTADLAAVYNLASVLAMPSLYEGFGLPVLEAMSCGCPFLAGNCGSLPEIIGEAGELVDPENIEEIKDRLLKLLKFPKEKRGKMIQKGLVQASKFSWEKTARETIKAYEEVLKDA